MMISWYSAKPTPPNQFVNTGEINFAKINFSSDKSLVEKILASNKGWINSPKNWQGPRLPCLELEADDPAPKSDNH